MAEGADVTPFGARLSEAVSAYGPLCAGIDPHASLLADWGLTDDVAGLETFASTVVEALAGEVAVVKPQSAFFERHGAAGVAVLERTIQDARAAGLLVLLDVKRGDIGSTAAAYADAYLDAASPMQVDAVTVSPYLGFGSLEPFLATAERNGGGVFVLALTSNPEGPEVQHARIGERTVAGAMLDHLRERNAEASPQGSYGAVVGATVGELTEDVDINGPLLIPGFGAQGGTVADLRRLFGPVWEHVLPASSRGILAAGPDVASLRRAARAVRDELA
ncbi:orotidine-5'-phosphate decarboxylase [Mumia zhuanghuii]|uniref:Orotidine 5'-phosphate decarboxylase n=1 Tax=Mumia zhuanghuii TaxID=2585211 RepID=A0A5Q6RYS7_9ACTN|nr:orotidine-5'-phosphate decarboxylase [Mumia zhuanghuii]